MAKSILKNIYFMFNSKRIKTFLKNELAKEKSLSFLTKLPPKYEDVLSSLNDSSKHRKLIELYNKYLVLSKGQNALVNNILSAQKNFPFNDILANPKLHNLSFYQEVYGKTLNDLDHFINLPKQIKEFKSNLESLLYDYDNICLEYDEYQKMLNFPLMLNTYDYIDGFIKDDLINIINTYYEKYNERKVNYYNKVEINLDELVLKHNNNYISLHLQDEIFSSVLGKSLDNEQKRAILTESEANLVIASAGSGKTLTICGKVAYLLNYFHIEKNQILLLSYSKKSALDLANKVALIDPTIKVSTFHALGLEILSKAQGKKLTVDDSFNAILEKYFREYIFTDEKALEKVLQYYALYLNNIKTKIYEDEGKLYEDLKKADFVTLKDELLGFNNSNKLETIKKELVRSQEELAIANFLFINGIDYEYEASYKAEDTATTLNRQYTPDFYLPEYDIYYEHYGINREGEATQYTKDEAIKYKAGITWKRALHAKNNTTCIETYSYEFSEGTIFKNLEERLKEHGVKFKPISKEKIYDAINSIYQGQSFKSFINLLRSFLSLYKARYIDDLAFVNLIKEHDLKGYAKIRATLFLEICQNIYKYYRDHLECEHKIDFDDMILKSKEALDSVDGFNYKYIIVDEFQDISVSRMEFLLKLIKKNKAKLFAVGDDFQAIYRFAGCDISIFLNFDKYFRDATKTYLTKTYRNSQELQDIAGPFIMANPYQYKKIIKSNSHLENPIKITYYDNLNKYKSLLAVLNDIAKKNSDSKVLLLGRNNNDLKSFLGLGMLEKSRDKIFCQELPNLELSFQTVHASKGLEADFVILLNANGDKYGFPNQMEDDPLLDLVLSDKSSFPFAEERRLFYVALTRTKSYLYILCDSNEPSIFVEEIKSKCEIFKSQLREEVLDTILCPKCHSGKLIKRQYNGETFLGCTNYPYCDYTNKRVNDVVKYHKKCPYCGNYMVLRRGPRGKFWGCSSFPNCKYTEAYFEPQTTTFKAEPHLVRH